MSLTIVGLGFLGTSLGLALKCAIPEMEIVGHDPSPELTSLAKKRGAIDKSHWNLPAACEQADIVLLDLPFAQVAPTLQVLAESLADDTLIVDFSPAKRAALDSASQLLPATIRYVGAYVVLANILAPDAEPSEAVLRDALFYLAVSPETNDRAINTAAGLADTIGAKPCFTAPDELDSLIAAGSQLPFVTAVALMSTWQQAGGWEDRKHALGASSLWVKQILSDLPDANSVGLWQNRDMLVAWLDRAIASMHAFRETLQESDSTLLDGAVSQVKENAVSAEQAGQPVDTFGNDDKIGFRQLFLGSVGRRTKRKR